MSRIQLHDSPISAIMKMSGGNPGAATVLTDIFKNGGNIDPQSAFGGLGAILIMDTFEIYEHRIWMLYKDVCGQDLVKTLALLRASQLGKLSAQKLNHAIDNFGEGVDVDEMLSIVRDTLKDFSPIDEPEEVALEEAV